MQSNLSDFEMTEEEAKKLEVTCGFCDRKIRIRSLTEHIKIEHSNNLNSKCQ